MAATRTSNQQPVGSSDWILKEFGEISNLCENELEDFTFSARNEVEWLNEHMNDIFSSNKIRLAEILKTPGKLRGKTPRTARQRSPLKEIRRPLEDIAPIDKRFNSPARAKHSESTFHFKKRVQQNAPPKKVQNVQSQIQDSHDSGYVGESPDEIEIPIPSTQDLEGDESKYARPASPESQLETQYALLGRLSTEGPIHSAKKEYGTVVQVVAESKTNQEVEDPAKDSVENGEKVSEQLRRESAEQQAEETNTDDAPEPNKESPEETNEAVSESSTPAKPMVRKSSLNFAALPKREPLATKKSMGNVRVSSQTSYFGRITGGKSLGAVRPVESDDDEEMDEDGDQENKPPVAESSKTLQTKSSTQRLHDRIAALGKAQPSRPTKSILVNGAASQAAYPALPEPDTEAQNTAIMEDKARLEEQPKEAMEPEEPEEPEETEEQVLPPSNEEITESRKTPEDQYQTSEDAPNPQDEPLKVEQTREASTEARISTTPAGSPPKHMADAQGPVNNSRSRLQTLMQSARGLFTSSAAASAQAKLEAFSVTSPKREAAQPSVEMQGIEQSRDLENEKPGPAEPVKGQEEQPEPETVSGSDEDLTRQQEENVDVAMVEDEPVDDAEEPAPRPQSAMGPPPARPRTALAKPSNTRRPITKPVKEQPAQQKVSIKLGSMAGRRPLTATTLTSAAKEQEQQQQQQVPRSGAAGKESLASTSTAGSTNSSSLKSSMSSKAKTLLAAERKKEAEEKAAAKKAAAKLELERKRAAAQQEEAHKREQARQAAERQKERERQAAEEKKRQEQRQAVERKRAEAQAKREQMQKEQQSALKSSHHPPRPVSRQAMVQDFPKPPSHASSKQAPKRVWDPEQQEDGPYRAAHTQGGKGVQHQNDGKRRKTEDEEELERPASVRPTMAPPMRMSNIKNTLKTSLFGSNYPRAPPPAAHHLASGQQIGGAPNTQQQQNSIPPRPPTAMDNARFQNGAIPFANNAPHPQSANPFKTPMQPARLGQANAQMQLQLQQQLMKSSPLNGENIHLDEIPTDSEDEDSEAERDHKADLPDWVKTPNLNLALMDQDSIDPGLVFGPIPPLNMEEMFKGKGQKKDFRSRTSSANWFGNDKLTEDEIRKDIEAREKMKRDGGWTFGL